MSKKSPPSSNVIALRKQPAGTGRRTGKAALTAVPEAPADIQAIARPDTTAKRGIATGKAAGAAGKATKAVAAKPVTSKAVSTKAVSTKAAAANDDAAPKPTAASATKAAGKKAEAPAVKAAKPAKAAKTVKAAKTTKAAKAVKVTKVTKVTKAAKAAKAATQANGKSADQPAAKPTGSASKASARSVPKRANGVAGAASPTVSGTSARTAKPALPPATEIPPSAVPPKAGSKLEKNLAARPANSTRSPIRIFQIYFEPWQKELLDPAFAALNNGGVKSEAMEFDVFERLGRSEHVRGATLWGALSWRFAEKTGMSGADLIAALQANPGMDVYYCNPYPMNEALFHNMWTQGETTHPRFLALSRAVFQAAGLPEDELSGIATSASCSAANYFIGSPAFWERYLPFVRKVLTLADKKLSPEARKLLHSTMADDRGLHHGATYVPFIVERLFPLFMKTEGKGLKGHKIALPEREREMNVHLKLLREMKDVAHRTRSPWLAACWVNYRNLYLSQVNGKAWCQKYLRAITPTDIKFS